jgi:lysozyme
MTTYLDLAAQLVKQLEGCKLTGYLDSVGKPTNGYGHTGPEVRVGVTITQEIADHDLDVDLSIADQRLQSVTQPIPLAKLDAHQRAALISFVFNVGADPKWSIWRDVNQGNLADVPTQLRRFVNGRIDGKEQIIPGLEHRREAECIFWNTADLAVAVSVATVATAVPTPPSGLTREIETPPTPVAAPALAKTSIVTKAVTVVGGATAALGSYGSQVHDIVAPHIDESPIFAHVAVAASAVVVVAACIGILIHAEQHQARAT